MPRGLEDRRIIEISRHRPPSRVKDMIISGGQNVFAVEVEALIACCKERITGFKVPRKILWTDAPLPRTPSGKVTKFVLVDQYSSK